MTGQILFDLTHTSHTRARTGIQRVVRSLNRELGQSALRVTYDPYLKGWRPLEDWEIKNLTADASSNKRSAAWPWRARTRGRIRRALGGPNRLAPPADCAGFLTAELFARSVGENLPEVFPRVAVFHDAIALRFPELTPPATVARFPHYLRELLRFDGVAAVSAESRDSLIGYWRWLGATRPPPVAALALGVDPIASDAPPATPTAHPPVVLSVGTLEGRKNQVALLDACEMLWTRGEKFSLRLAGSLQAQTGRTALERLRSLQRAGRPVRYDGPLSEADLADAYAECAFTVYPSVAEGFGLPVVESLARGRPCICSGRGALGEISRRGGCVAVDSLSAEGLSAAIADLLHSPASLARLGAAARAQTYTTWSAYAAELTAWMKTLPRRT